MKYLKRLVKYLYRRLVNEIYLPTIRLPGASLPRYGVREISGGVVIYHRGGNDEFGRWRNYEEVYQFHAPGCEGSIFKA